MRLVSNTPSLLTSALVHRRAQDEVCGKHPMLINSRPHAEFFANHLAWAKIEACAAVRQGPKNATKCLHLRQLSQKASQMYSF